MIEVEIVPCEPHRAFHGLMLVHGLRRRPVSARFSIQMQDAGKARYLGPSGWDPKFAECRYLMSGWDVERKILWVLVGPEVTLLLDEGPFTFTLLQTGEQVPELTLPETIREPGDGELPVPPSGGDRNAIPMMPVPATGLPDEPVKPPPSRPRPSKPTPAPVEPAAAPPPPPKPVAPTPAPPAPASPPPAVEVIVGEPQKDMPVKPVVLGIAAFLGVAMGVAYLLSGGGSTPAPAPAPMVASAPPATTPSPAASPAPPAPPPAPAPVTTPAQPPTPPPAAAEAKPPPPAAPPAPVATAPAAPAPAPAPTPAPSPATTPEPAAPAVVAVAKPAEPPAKPAPPPAAPLCGSIANPGSLYDLPPGTPQSDGICVARFWIKVGRANDAVALLSVAPYTDYAPALLELGKLYDPRSRLSNPPASADFAKDEYRKAIQKTDDEAVKKEAQLRLDALMKQ